MIVVYKQHRDSKAAEERQMMFTLVEKIVGQ